MAALILFFLMYFISSISSINSTNCNYLYVSPNSFKYNGWYQYFPHQNYWYSMDTPHIVQILIHDKKWYFYNWNHKNESYRLPSQTNANINSLPVSLFNDSNIIFSIWNSMHDTSPIQLNIICSNYMDTSISDTLSIHTTNIPYHEQISWLINNENCHAKSRVYAALTTNDLSTDKISAYWNIPILSNNESNITVSISGNYHQYDIGQHKITYAAENTQYFIMCQITLYIIGDVSRTDMYKCTELSTQTTGIIDLIVDKNTFLVIDPNKYEYEISKSTNNNPIQVSYIIPDFIDQSITCKININWANIGNEIISSIHNNNTSTSSNNFIAWQVLIVLCVMAIFGLICERIYFYRRIYKTKYQSVDSNDADLSLNMDAMDPVQIPFGRKTAYEQTRSLSVSAVGSYNNPFNNNTSYSPKYANLSHNNNNNNNISQPRAQHNRNLNNRSSTRAMSMQISAYPFTRPPTKQEFFEQRRRKSSASKSMDLNDEIVPLAINNNKNKQIKTRSQRYMSVPTNLMSDNVLKKHKQIEEKEIIPTLWINDYEQADFWKKELSVLKEAGFENKKKNLQMLLKYVVKNEQHIVDKKMTQSVVIRILQKEQKEQKQKLQNAETEIFLENEWENKNMAKNKNRISADGKNKNDQQKK